MSWSAISLFLCFPKFIMKRIFLTWTSSWFSLLFPKWPLKNSGSLLFTEKSSPYWEMSALPSSIFHCLDWAKLQFSFLSYTVALHWTHFYLSIFFLSFLSQTGYSKPGSGLWEASHLGFLSYERFDKMIFQGPFQPELFCISSGVFNLSVSLTVYIIHENQL